MKTMGKNRVRVYGAVGFAVCLIFGAAGSFAAGTTSSDPTVSGPQISSLPPTFDGSVAQSMGSQMLNCFNVGAALNSVADAMKTQGPGTGIGDQLGNGLGGASANLGGGGIAFGGGCGNDQVDSSSFSCSLYSSVDAINAAAKAKMDRIDGALRAVSCKKNKFEAVQTQLSCLQSQSQTLQAQIGTLQKAFQDNIQKMQTDVALIKSVQTDRKTQLEDTMNHRKEIETMRDAVQKAVNTTLPSEVLTIKKNFKDLDNAKKALQEMIDTRTMQNTTNCFNTSTAGGYRCVPNGPPVSIRDYVLCRYEQNQRLGDGGVIINNQIVANQASASRQSLEALLSAIMQGSAKLPAIGGNSQSTFDPMNSTVTMNTPDDIETQYGGQLTGFNGKGLNIHDFVMSQMRSCYSTAQKVIAREKTMSSSGIGQQQAQFDERQRANQTTVATFFDRYGQLYTQAMATLTGVHLPLDTSACTNANPNVQMNCADDIQRNMSGLLNGNTPNSTMNIQIRGTNASNNIPITCQGLQGCATKLKTTSENLDREVKRLDQFKSDYVLKANQNVEKFAKQMASTLSPQSSMLQQKLQSLSQALAGLGVSPLVIKGIQGEQLEKDEDGLPRSPKNVLGLIGSQMNPPMPDFQGDSFAEGLRNISEGRNRLDETQSRAMQAKSELSSAKDGCVAQLQEKNGTSLMTMLDRFQTCTTTQDYCDKLLDDNGPFSSLMGTMNDMDLVRDDVSVSGVLQAGVADCQKRRGDAASKATLLPPQNLCDQVTDGNEKIKCTTKYFNDFNDYQTKLADQKSKAWTGSSAGCPTARAISGAMGKYQKISGSGDGSGSGLPSSFGAR